MGEYAEMMLDGTCCAGCGEWLGGFGDSPGYPGYCAGCAPDFAIDEPVKKFACPECGKRLKTKGGVNAHRNAVHGIGKVPCPDCGKQVSERGLTDHIRMKHGDNQAAE